MNQNVVGLILSLPNEIIDRILHGRTIYAGPGPGEPILLKTGGRIFFYDSDRSGVLTAEAKIAKVASERSDEILRYGAKLFLSKDEFDAYLARMNHAGDDRVVVLELEEVTEYMRPVKCPFSVPPKGIYVTEDTFKEILRANS